MTRAHRCSVCGGRGPLIDGRCVPHLDVTTEAALHTVSAEDVLADELDRIGERCPDCGGLVEVTPSGALTCREHGSAHYRWTAEVAS